MPKSNFRVDFSYEMCFYFGVIKWLGIFFLSLFVVVGVGVDVAAEMRLIYWARFSCWKTFFCPSSAIDVCVTIFPNIEVMSHDPILLNGWKVFVGRHWIWFWLNCLPRRCIRVCVCASASKGDRDTSKDMVSLSELNDGSSNSDIIRDRCGKCMRPSQVKYCKKIRRTEIWTRKCISWSACKMHEWKVSQRKKREGDRIKSLIEKLNYFWKSASSSAYMFTHTHTKTHDVGTLLEI